jgi:hypothetical protein
MPTVIPKNRKDTIIEVLDAVAKFYEEHRPEYYHYLLREIPKLRQVSTPGYTNSKGEFTSVRLKVPTEMFLCVQHILPGFGKTMEDIKIMTECWKNLNGAVPMKRSGPCEELKESSTTGSSGPSRPRWSASVRRWSRCCSSAPPCPRTSSPCRSS